MPNLTPIPLTEEEHKKLTSLKHKLEASSWREMLMKLCDIYEEYCQMKFDIPLAKEGIVTDNPEVKNYVNKLVDERLKDREGKNPKEKNLMERMLEPDKGGESEMDEEDVRRILKEELENWKIELPEHNHKPKEEYENCPECSTPLSKTKKPKYCHECGEELDWED